MIVLRDINNVVVATLRDRRLIHTGPGQSGAKVTTESLKSRRHAASAAAAAGPYLLGAPKPSPPADAGVADANRPPNPGPLHHPRSPPLLPPPLPPTVVTQTTTPAPSYSHRCRRRRPRHGRRRAVAPCTPDTQR